jgi:hypothetical protein
MGLMFAIILITGGLIVGLSYVDAAAVNQTGDDETTMFDRPRRTPTPQATVPQEPGGHPDGVFGAREKPTPKVKPVPPPPVSKIGPPPPPPGGDKDRDWDRDWDRDHDKDHDGDHHWCDDHPCWQPSTGGCGVRFLNVSAALNGAIDGRFYFESGTNNAYGSGQWIVTNCPINSNGYGIRLRMADGSPIPYYGQCTVQNRKNGCNNGWDCWTFNTPPGAPNIDVFLPNNGDDTGTFTCNFSHNPFPAPAWPYYHPNIWAPWPWVPR